MELLFYRKLTSKLIFISFTRRRLIHQQISRLTLQVFADFLQCVKAHPFDFALFEQRHVGLGDADVLGQVFGLDFAPRQHDVQLDDDGHRVLTRFLDELLVFVSQGLTLADHVGHQPHKRGKKQREQLVGTDSQRQLARAQRIVPGEPLFDSMTYFLKTRVLAGLALIAAILAITACTGVPLRAIPKLMQLNQQLMDANPAEFLVALQVDARMVPPPGALPLLHLKVTPRDLGAFEVIDKKLPLQLAVASISTQGLEAPGSARRWLIYSLPAPSQAELKQIQTFIKTARAQAQPKGGSLTVGVEQDSLIIRDPVLANTRWETWLQSRQAGWFFEVWSGTPAQLLKLAAEQRK